MEMYGWWMDFLTEKDGSSSVGTTSGERCVTQTGSEGIPMLRVNS